MQANVDAFMMGTRSPGCYVPCDLIPRIAQLVKKSDMIDKIREQLLIHKWTPVSLREYKEDRKGFERKELHAVGEELCALLEREPPETVLEKGPMYLQDLTEVNTDIERVRWYLGLACAQLKHPDQKSFD